MTSISTKNLTDAEIDAAIESNWDGEFARAFDDGRYDNVQPAYEIEEDQPHPDDIPF